MSGTLSQHARRRPDGSLSLPIRVTPSSRRAHIKVDGSGVRVYVAEPAQDGQANEAAIKAIAKQMGRPRAAITIISGEFARDKVLRIAP